MATEPRLVWEVEAELGEGPVWVERDQALFFTDIKRQRIYRFDPVSGDQRSWHAPEQIGFILPSAGGGFIAGLQSGLSSFEPESGRFTPVAAVEPELPDNRINDGVVDPAGRLWFGTMDNSERSARGAFYCYDRGALRRTPIEGVAITNGPAVSPDGRTLYWVDTLGRSLSAAPIGADGQLGPSRTLITFDRGEGNPDGPTVDREGGIWIGLYGGWEARRYDPAGSLLERVRFPVANITKLALGGADLRTAFATTARHLLGPEQLTEPPLAGGLFAFEVDVPGIASPCVAEAG
jgi:xylono-1,5-lactonase